MNDSDLIKKIWQQLQRASVDKHHEWRSPVLVTNGLDGWPDARTIILRNVNLETKILTFYTDSRSPKLVQLYANTNAMLVFWSKRLNWQCRIKVAITIKTDGELLQKTWAKVKQSPSAGDYLSVLAPGESLNKISDNAEQINLSKHYFATINAHVISIDWLALSRNGHQRATIIGNSVTPIAP